MASIDKIYGSNEQYDEFHAWCSANNAGLLQWFNDRENYTNASARVITNFPEDADMWLLDNCPIQWVIQRIRDQYGMEEDADDCDDTDDS